MGKLARHLHLGLRGSLRVALAQDALLPGDAVAGTVHVNIAKPIQAAMLKVRVHGRQGLNWMTSSGDAMIAHSKYIDTLLEEVILEADDTAFEVGDTQYAFSFQLPEDLQPNFSFTCKRIEELQGVRVHVKYVVEATLVVKGVATSNLDASAAFTVEPLPMAVPWGSPVCVTDKQEVKFLSMFNHGSCNLALELDSDVFDSTSTIKAHVTLQLETARNLKFILLVLYEDVALDRHNALFRGHKQGSRIVCCRRFDQTNLAALRGPDGGTHMTLQLPITPNEISETGVLNPTMASLFVNLSYRVAVECKFSLARRVKVHAPVTLVRKLVEPTDIVIAVPA